MQKFFFIAGILDKTQKSAELCFSQMKFCEGTPWITLNNADLGPPGSATRTESIFCVSNGGEVGKNSQNINYCIFTSLKNLSSLLLSE